MVRSITTGLVASLMLAASVTAAPMNFEGLENVPDFSPNVALVTRAELEARQQCQKQSCIVADVAGSTGRPITITKLPDYATKDGTCCVISYNPEAAELLYQYDPSYKTYCASKTITNPEAKKTVPAAACAPKTLIFAKGTFEPTPLGLFVGPGLSQAVMSGAFGQWSVIGLDYDASLDGIFCLGEAGGFLATKYIDAVASRCPNTKIYLSGYSQGAMAVRNGLARSANGARVKGVVTFGDPFNGAPIKNYNGPISINCAAGDQVCDGTPIITLNHFGYGSNVQAAAKQLNAWN